MSTKIGTATDYLDLLDQLDDFLVTTGHAWAKSYAGTGNGDITSYLGTSSSVAETFTITATSATNFTVSGSVTGALAAATVGTPYTSSKIAFTINAGATPFVAGDVFTLTTSPPWERMRREGCADTAHRSTDMASVDNLFDGNVNTYATKAGTTCFVDLDMHVASEVREFVVSINGTTQAPASLRLQWKNNIGDAWTTAQTWTGQTWSNSNEARQFNLSSAPGSHRYWRFEVLTSTGSSLQLGSLELHAKPGDAYSIAENFNLVWRAPGLDGTKNIYVGVQTYGNNSSDTWNLGFSGFRSYNSGAGVGGQANGSGQKWVPCINSAISYWFVANGQRVIVVAKFSGVFQVVYLGFGLPYETPTVHPFPHVVAGAHQSRTLRYDSQSGIYRNAVDPGDGAMSAFYPDGQWRSHANRAITGSDTPDGNPATSIGGKVWPTAFSGGADARLSTLRENLDGSRALLPCILYSYLAPLHMWGELDGLYWTTGFGTVSEATIREGKFDHLVANCVFRTGVHNYCAVRMD